MRLLSAIGVVRAILLSSLCANLGSAQIKMTSEVHGDSLVLTFEPAVNPPVAFTGRAYSAVQINYGELTDGTATTYSTRRLYRDSSGRTRSEESLTTVYNEDRFLLVDIVDPEGFEYVLDPVHQVAHRLAVTVKSIPVSTQPPPCQRGPVAPPHTGARGVTSVMESLGEQTIEGIRACGERFTSIRPPGSWFGNTAELRSVSETWQSQGDRLPVVLTRSTEPEGRTSGTRLKDVDMAEPDIALFRPPAGYRVVDETGKFTITLPRQAKVSKTAPSVEALTDLPFTADERISPVKEGSPSHTLARIYRDAAGRTRRESYTLAVSGEEQVRQIEIQDVVAGYSYSFRPDSLTAERRALKVKVSPASLAKLPMARPTSTETLHGGVQGITEWLGIKNIAGFEVYGERTTLKYPPNTLGANDRPLVTMDETWTSPLLGTQLVMKLDNPQLGSSVSTLTNIRFGAPDPSLFVVPEGYKIVDK